MRRTVLVWLDVVGDAQARLGLALDGEAVVEVAADAGVEGPVAGGDLVLGVEGELLDVGVAVEGVVAAAAGEVVGQQVGVEACPRPEGSLETSPALAHWVGLVKPGSGLPLASTQGELKVALTMASGSFSRRKRLRVLGADLDVVDALHVGDGGVERRRWSASGPG